jgi:Gp37 protein
MLQEIEAAIAQQLEVALLGKPLRLRAFPDNPKEMGLPTPKGQILVGYKRSGFRKVGDFPLSVEMLSEWEISIQLTNLRTHTGVYPLLDLTRTTLFGFVPLAGMDRGMYPVSESFSDLDEGTWYYTQSWIAPLMLPREYEVIEPQTPIEVTRIVGGIWRSPVGSLPQDQGAAQLDREFELNPEP